MRGEIKRKYEKVQPRTRNLHQRSIDIRPDSINSREEFGHWELDTVIGKRDGKNSVLAVFTERKTRHEIIRKVSGKTREAIKAAVDELEALYSADFSKIFRSITMDNGGEFADDSGIERSIFNPDKRRTVTYYCHPYRSGERGSNENQNKHIRRKVPKGSPIDDYTEEYIAKAERWLNGMYRPKFGNKCSAELFTEELAALGIEINKSVVA